MGLSPMTHAAKILLALLCALPAACGRDAREAGASRSEQAARRDALPTSWRLPAGWIWVTETREGYAVGLPGLPRGRASADHSVSMLTRETPSATYTIARRAGLGDPAGTFRTGALGGGGTLVTDEAWRGNGRAFEVRSPAGIEQARILLRADDALVLSVMSPAQVDAAPFFESLTFDALTTPRRVHHDEGRFSIEAPVRVNPLVDESAQPVLRGLHGLRDGVQIAAMYVAAPITAESSVALEAGMRSAVRDMPGELLSSEPRDGPTGPELWYRCRAQDGTFGSVRTTYANGNLYTIATYAHVGEEPPWAQHYLESFTLDGR